MIQTLKLPLLLSLALLSVAQNGCIYRTQTQGDWGLSCSDTSPRPDFSPGCYLEANFNTCIGNSPLIIGCQAPGLSIQFTNYLSCKNFLPQVPTPNLATPLTQGWVDPVGQIGQFAGELVALTLSLKFDECNADFSSCNLLLKDLFLCDNRNPATFVTAGTTATDTGVVNPDSGIPAATSDDDDDDDDGDDDDDDRRRHAPGQFQNCLPFYGWTIARLYAEAQAVFGGCSTSNTFTANELNDCLALINQEFAYGRAIAANDIFSVTACAGVPFVPTTSVSIPVTSSSSIALETSSSSIPTSAVLSTTTVVVGTGGDDAGAQDRQTIGQNKASVVSLSMLLLPILALLV